jgi:hypothetical protein
LRNRLQDLKREQRRRQRLGHVPPGVDVPVLDAERAIRSTDLRLDLLAPFSPEDLRLIEAWPPWDRVVLLCLGLVWQKVPAPRWACWLVACGLKPPFPPREYIECLDGPRQERHACLARLLGWSNNTLAQRWCRGQKVLKGLAFMKELEQSRQVR